MILTEQPYIVLFIQGACNKEVKKKKKKKTKKRHNKSVFIKNVTYEVALKWLCVCFTIFIQLLNVFFLFSHKTFDISILCQKQKSF